MSQWTRQELAENVCHMLETWGKVPVLVKKDLPGQLANRIFQAVIREAAAIVEAGIAEPEDVDTAIKMGMGLRFPVWGPLEHVDAVGLELCESVQNHVLPSISSSRQAADIFREIAKHGYVVTVHAEDMELVKNYTEHLKETGRDQKDFLAHVEARPDIVELSALHRTFVLSEVSGCKVHITHLTSRRGLELIKEYQRRGIPVTSDVGPSWFTFCAEDYEKYGGGIRVIPAIRYQNDTDALWEGLACGDIEVMATDHAPHSNEEKFERSWWDTLPGTIGVQTSLPILLDRANKGEITLNRIVDCYASQPARIFGLYPRKGLIAPGADADITIFNPQTGKAEFVIVQGRTLLSRGILHSGTPTAFCTDKGLSFYERKNLPVFSVTPNLTRLNRSLNP